MLSTLRTLGIVSVMLIVSFLLALHVIDRLRQHMPSEHTKPHASAQRNADSDLIQTIRSNAPTLLADMCRAGLLNFDVEKFRFTIDDRLSLARGKDKTAEKAEARKRLSHSRKWRLVTREISRWNSRHSMAGVRTTLTDPSWQIASIRADTELFSLSRKPAPAPLLGSLPFTFGFMGWDYKTPFNAWKVTAPTPSIRPGLPDIRFLLDVRGRQGQSLILEVAGAQPNVTACTGSNCRNLAASERWTAYCPGKTGDPPRLQVPPICEVDPSAGSRLPRPTTRGYRLALTVPQRTEKLAITAIPVPVKPAWLARYRDVEMASCADMTTHAEKQTARRSNGDTRFELFVASETSRPGPDGKTIRSARLGYRWLPPPEKPASGSNQIAIRTRRGHALLEGTPVASPTDKPADTTPLQAFIPGSERMSDNGYRAGLAPIVGMDRHDVGGLLSHVARRLGRSEKISIDLTIDLDVQDPLNSLLRDIAERRIPQGPSASRWRTALQGGILRHLPGELDRVRRSVLLVMDGDGAQAGAIRAVASYPAAESKSDRWSLIGFNEWWPEGSPLAARGFNQTDQHTFAGSTFKPLTALAAIQEVGKDGRVDDPLARLLLGQNLDSFQKDFKDNLCGDRFKENRCHKDIVRTKKNFVTNGIRYDVFQVPGWERQRPAAPYGYSNFGGVDLTGQALPPKSTGCLPSPHLAGERQIGVCEALMKSSNIYFAALAQRMDGAKLLRADGTGERDVVPDDIALVTMAERLFGRESAFRSGNIEALPLELLDDFQGLGWSGTDGRHGRLRPLPFQSDLKRQKDRLLLALSNNAIGQSQQQTPLQAGVVAGSIAAGRILRPYLIANARLTPAIGDPRALSVDQLGRSRGLGEQLFEDNLQNRLLEQVRRGMYAVVEKPGGTAEKSLRAWRESQDWPEGALAAKTGTAEIILSDDESYNTVWMMGWIDLDPSEETLRQRKIFVCMVTHTLGGTGSGICGPIIEQVLDTLVGTTGGL